MSKFTVPAIPIFLTPIPLSDGAETSPPDLTGIALGTDGNVYTAKGDGRWRKASAVSE